MASPSSASGSLTSTLAFAIKTHTISAPYLKRIILFLTGAGKEEGFPNSGVRGELPKKSACTAYTGYHNP
jgi:hypothetical protein